MGKVKDRKLSEQEKKELFEMKVNEIQIEFNPGDVEYEEYFNHFPEFERYRKKDE